MSLDYQFLVQHRRWIESQSPAISDVPLRLKLVQLSLQRPDLTVTERDYFERRKLALLAMCPTA